MRPFFNFVRAYWPLAIIFTICILVFVLDQIAVLQETFFMDRFWMIPAEVSMEWKALLNDGFDWSQLEIFSTLFSYALMHADTEHILMNLIFIWVFGSLVYRELGAVWFFITFVLAAVFGSVGQVLLDPLSEIPVLGASGALMGLEGIYLGMAVRWRLPNPDVWPIACPISQERLVLFAAFGLILDFTGILGNEGGIAFGAHIGGFITGLLLGTTIIPRPKHALGVL